MDIWTSEAFAVNAVGYIAIAAVIGLIVVLGLLWLIEECPSAESED